MDKNVLKVLIVWFVPNLSIGALYLAGILRASVLVLLCAFYYFSDLICLLFFCPFRTLFLKNRCCVSCRAYTWGAWMMVTPMMFIPHWYSQVLFWAGTLAFICWEVRYRKYPERFWEGSNRTLQCAHCKELICQYKVPHARRFY